MVLGTTLKVSFLGWKEAQWAIRRASFRAADATKLLLLIFCCFAAFSISICS